MANVPENLTYEYWRKNVMDERLDYLSSVSKKEMFLTWYNDQLEHGDLCRENTGGKEQMKTINTHAYKTGEFGLPYDLFVACEYDASTGYISVSGVEYDKDEGYAYFTFDDYVKDLDSSSKAEVMAYLGNSTDKGFSCAWFNSMQDVLKEYPEKADPLLWKLAADKMPGDAALAKKTSPADFTITLHFDEESVQWLREKFTIEKEQDLTDAVKECISTYMEM